MPDQLPVISINGKTPASSYEGYSYVFISGNTAYCYSVGEDIAPEHMPGNVPEYIPPSQDWLGLKTLFSTPGDALYNSVLAKVGQANDNVTDDVWTNLKLTILLSEYWEVNRLSAAIRGLQQILAVRGFPMDSADVMNWNNIMDAYRFPSICKIPLNP